MGESDCYMEEVLRLARKAYEERDVPIGAVLVYDGTVPVSPMGKLCREMDILPGTILGRGWNQRNAKKNALYHAEIFAIEEACKKIGDWRLEDCTLYVNLEPCPMCAGAIVMSRISRVVYGSTDSKAGACESLFNITGCPGLNHQPDVCAGVLAEECAALLKNFFRERRKRF